MKRALRTEWFREIKYSLPRFLSILFLVALGVAFFAGIRATEPDMRLTIDEQYDHNDFMDVRIVSTLGLTKNDVSEISKVKGVRKAEGAYTKDVLCQVENRQLAIKVYSQSKDLNKMRLVKGRKPVKSGECLADARFATENGVKLGDVIEIRSGDDEKITETFRRTKFKVTGFCEFDYYLTRHKGTTSIGNGNLEGFLVVPEKDFSMDVYTDIYLTVNGAKSTVTYSKEYEDIVKAVTDRIKEIKKEREKIRYDAVRNKGQDKIDDAKKTYQNKKSKTKKKLSKAKKDLNQAKKDLDQAQKKLEQAKRKIKNGKTQIKTGQKQYKSGIAKWKKGKASYEDGIRKYEKGFASYETSKGQLAKSRKVLEQTAGSYGITLDQLTPQYGQLYEEYQKYLVAKKKLDAVGNTMNQTKQKLESSKRQLDASKRKLDQAKRQLVRSKQQIVVAQKGYEKGVKDLKNGKAKYEKGLREYKKNKKKAEDGFKRAEKKIKDAEEALSDIKKCKWYILDRTKIQSYMEYDGEADRIGAIGKVFPMIFFLVAALVSLTTMTRMVEKERTEMGTMKALGYSKIQIAGKYMIYASLATIIGSVIGITAGEKILPSIIINAYGMMYIGVHNVATPIRLNLGIMAMAMAFVSTIGTTIFACYKELTEVPAMLMRPEAPKEGKRVFLERIPFLWSRVSFLWKSSIRNLLRYKKRFFMTIIGIGGCMALLLVGFGLSDSIFSITNNQFTKVHVYDGRISFDEDDKNLEDAMNTIQHRKEITDGVRVRDVTMNIENENGSKTAYVIVPEDHTRMEKYIHFVSRTSDDTYHLGDDGVIITEKVAKMLNIKKGDTISLKEGETKTIQVKVSAIAENYLSHYVFISKKQYEQLYGEKVVYNEYICNLKKHSSAYEKKLSEKLLEIDGVNRIVYVSEAEKEMADMLSNLDIVIFVLVFSAGLLAFVVLYNLNNINIEERRRELATVKVLGFYQTELAAYVYRENIMLTLIGTFAGVFMGIALHRYVIMTAEVDYIMFGRTIFALSYVKSIVLTIFFSVIVNAVMYFKLKRIDMVESLKSVE